MPLENLAQKGIILGQNR